MKKLFEKSGKGGIPVFCYLAALCIALLTGLFNFGYDSIGRMTGRQKTMVLTPQDFQLVNLEQREDGTWISTNDDPMLILDTAGMNVRRVSVEAAYDRDPYERCMYYTKKPGEPYDPRKRSWPEYSADGLTSLYELPIGVKTIRLDPGSLAALQIDFGEIVLNPPRAFYSYFVPSGGGWFCLAVLPALAASLLEWLTECKQHFDKKRGSKKHE